MSPLALPTAALAAARRKMAKYDLPTQAIMGYIDGASKVTGKIAGAIKKATDYSKKTARKDSDSAPKPDDNSLPGIAKRAWKVLSDPNYAKSKAAENTKEHHRQMAPFVNKVNKEAEKVMQDTEHHSALINLKQGGLGKTISKATEMLPELITSGSTKTAQIANGAIGAVQDYGENKSLVGAVSKAIVPGNSVLSNVGSNLVSEALVSKRRALGKE